MKSPNAFSALLDIYISPSKAFNGVEHARGWSWLAFIVMSLVSMASIYIFYSTVDMQFLINEQVAASTIDATIGEQKMIRQSIEQNAEGQVWFGLFGGVIALAIMNALMALYYMLVAKQDPASEHSYGAWYGFSTWTMMPVVISSLGTIALVLSASTDQISQQAVFSYASINQLIIGLEIGHPFYSLLESINLFSFWSIALGMIGLKCWTNFSTNKALLFSALPSIIIFGIWAIIAAS
ncbi:MAG TPA: YIP1 family protein [Pseudoalteromonas sp.]|jgi:hypothetical protein|uniref:YIP1 family protein n=2 Tax=root TaxID=1 RepID=A0A7X9U9G7_9GAMM|nr:MULTISPECIES: YIP1 family protein [Pseudoalteromonas]MBH0081443.1 YIP1 family protein [Pseudoalteromonas sp. NZS11]NMF49999.1 YIP1 family protein [Pseudoalteromonas arctica]HDY91782.1 YIP1 family protein [Pseudoalteromonas sp.]HDZ32270.1 YIP1 family protein [Pseudoalteromonas sp.]